MAFSLFRVRLEFAVIAALGLLANAAHAQEAVTLPVEASAEQAATNAPASAADSPATSEESSAEATNAEPAPAAEESVSDKDSAPSEAAAEPAASSDEETAPARAPEPSACEAATDSCTATCKRFDEGDARLAACTNFCETRLSQCAVPDESGGAAVADASTRPELEVSPLLSKKDMLKALELNASMIAAIRAGNMKGIRRLVEADGLSPTYVRTYEYNPESKRFDGRVVRLRLTDLFNDTNFLRNDALGLDKIVALFIELGMDVKATLPTKVAAPTGSQQSEVVTERTAWGPGLKVIETARDRGARVRAFELAMQKGLVPSDNFSDWLFAELPQVCGRDKSVFAIQIFDLLIEHLGGSLQEPLWREGEKGPETVSDVLDRSFGAAQIKTTYDKQQSVLQDQVWENCTPLSRRINRYLTQGR